MLSSNSRYPIYDEKSVINPEVNEDHSTHGVNTNVTTNNTNDKTNIETTSSKQKDKTTVHRDNDDSSNLIKRQSANSSTAKKEVVIIDDSMNKYVNGQEVSCNKSVKVRSRPGATAMTLRIMSDQLFAKNLI